MTLFKTEQVLRKLLNGDKRTLTCIGETFYIAEGDIVLGKGRTIAEAVGDFYRNQETDLT